MEKSILCFSQESRWADWTLTLGVLESIVREDAAEAQLSELNLIVSLVPGAGPVEVEFNFKEHPKLVSAKLRGVAAAIVRGNDAIVHAMLRPPIDGPAYSQPPGQNGEAKQYVVDQREVGTMDLGVLDRHGVAGALAVRADTQCWNCSPFGSWEFWLETVAGGSAVAEPLEVVLSFRVQHRKP